MIQPPATIVHASDSNADTVDWFCVLVRIPKTSVFWDADNHAFTVDQA